jgi:hypothetical protein
MKEVRGMALKARQLDLIEALLANPMVTDVDVAKQIGINRNTVRVWKQLPEFQEEYKKRLKEKWESSELMAMETMQTLARSGDFKASKYILDSLGYAPTIKQEVHADVNTDIVINIED